MAYGSRNETNLIGRPALDKAALEKMRSKLVTARPAQAAPRLVTPRATAKARKGRRAWIYMLAGAALLGGVNIVFHSEKDAILGLIGISEPASPAAPRAGLTERDKALFWAYAAYDREKLKGRFALGPKQVIDPADAEHHLMILMGQGAVTPDAEKEIRSLRAARGLPTEGKAL